MESSKTKKLVLTAMFTAIAYILPFFTVQIKQVGNMLCPMHIPVMLCGFICGWQYGAVAGLVVPLLRSLTVGLPVMFPNAVCMSVELATYAIVCGLTSKLFKEKYIFIYLQLLMSMVLGRVVWGIAMWCCLGLSDSFTFNAFITSAFLNSILGIVLQIVVIPPLVQLLRKQVNKSSDN